MLDDTSRNICEIKEYIQINILIKHNNQRKLWTKIERRNANTGNIYPNVGTAAIICGIGEPR